MKSHIVLWSGALPVKRVGEGKPIECRCGWTSGFLARKILANGSQQIRWQCESCGDFKSFEHIPHSFLEQFGVSIADLPVCEDDLTLSTPCIICGEIGTEWHHWAPRSIFSDLPQWSDVGAYLCLQHHREWHDRMRAHGLRYPHELVA